jgi:hypothetical protein
MTKKANNKVAFKRESRVERQIEKLSRSIDKRFDAVDKRFDAVDKRFDELSLSVEERFHETNSSIGVLEDKLIHHIGASKMAFASIDARFEEAKEESIRNGKFIGARIENVRATLTTRIEQLQSAVVEVGEGRRSVEDRVSVLEAWQKSASIER